MCNLLPLYGVLIQGRRKDGDQIFAKKFFPTIAGDTWDGQTRSGRLLELFRRETYHTINLSGASELMTPGGAIRFEGKNLPRRVLVVYGEDGEYRAFHNRCTHLGHRRLDPVPGSDTVQCCSLNRSTYNLDGQRIFGPAPRPITRYPVKKDQTELIVSIS